MTKSYTTNYDEWKEAQTPVQTVSDTIEIFSLSVPLSLRKKFKGFAFDPVFKDDLGQTQECQTRVLPANDSICNYDFSDCYLYKYELWTQDQPKIDPDTFQAIANEPNVFTSKVRIRYAGKENRIEFSGPAATQEVNKS